MAQRQVGKIVQMTGHADLIAKIRIEPVALLDAWALPCPVSRKKADAAKARFFAKNPPSRDPVLAKCIEDTFRKLELRGFIRSGLESASNAPKKEQTPPPPSWQRPVSVTPPRQSSPRKTTSTPSPDVVAVGHEPIGALVSLTRRRLEYHGYAVIRGEGAMIGRAKAVADLVSRMGGVTLNYVRGTDSTNGKLVPFVEIHIRSGSRATHGISHKKMKKKRLGLRRRLSTFMQRII